MYHLIISLSSMYQSIYLSIYILSIIFHLSPSLYVSSIYLSNPNHEGGISSEPLPDLQVHRGWSALRRPRETSLCAVFLVWLRTVICGHAEVLEKLVTAPQMQNWLVPKTGNM